MKLFTPEISWHQKEPIFSVDFCPKTWKLASCGADFTIKLWLAKEKTDDDSSIGLEFLANLDRHTKPVNVVRFSPNGKFLASAGDDGVIILWKLNESEKSTSGDLFDCGDDAFNKESWLVHKMLRGHIEDVYDLAWSPDSMQLISGSVDNSAIVWDTVKGQSQKIITDHKHYIQGVCWDPRGHYIVTHSSDRSCRIYQSSTHRCLHNIHKNKTSTKKEGRLVKSKLSRMFMDESMQSFFRRCTFSPDGTYLFLPAGLYGDGESKPRKTTYVFARGHYKNPIRHLPGTRKATVCVKCSPIVYELRDDKENALPSKENKFFKVPYRMVYAVASLDSITLYDTQHQFPIAHCSNMHYASLTDMAWSSDGKLLVISSTDGYCSFVKFDEKEFGTPISYDFIDYQVTQAKIRKSHSVKSAKKRDSKTKETEKTDHSLNEDSSVKLSVTPTRNELKKVTPSKDEKSMKSAERNHKEKGGKSVDRNQPTIDKLFVTPLRKRKREEVIPSMKVENVAKLEQTSASPSNQEASPSLLLSPSSLNGVPKAPKRAQVITISTTKECVTTVQKETLDKTPKRVSVTTLETFASEKPLNERADVNLTPTSVSSASRPPKRVTVTTLSSESSGSPSTFPDRKDLVLSPTVKTPKRVQVTTLSTFNSNELKSTGNEFGSTKTEVHEDLETSKSDVKSKSQIEVISID